MKPPKTTGQVSITVAIVMGCCTVVGAGITGWATASGTIHEISARIGVVEEREDNHYQEVLRSLERIENKLDKAI